ncbi:serine hydrolase [Paenibacillus sp. J2TS4]|uniref:serine hydrolase domain-containing protein n=1 Tax=Paenibacillus sp. J2TS4 TaxID=2807194 RepID=UPI001B279487|nr:serine hydrolase [Paenibacillus sp. J2TS4]GIP31801.1 penicillin-binding protein [Paenibacillus sp. J2TS4]
MNPIEMELDIEITDAFSGAVLIKDDERILYKAEHGYANRSDRLANQLTTKFAMASGSKLFTAVAVCQLIERGLLSYETTLKECLDVSQITFSHDVNIHQLLSHSSGIPDYFDEEVMTDYEHLWLKTPMYRMQHPKDFLPLFQNQSMKFSPGERFSYSNSGYILLGQIIENVTGESFRKYIEHNIFEACGMSNTGYFRMDQLPAQTALGYIDGEENGQWRTNIYSIPVIGQPDGGAYTTVFDMDRFWDHFLNGALLTKETVNQMLAPQIKTENHTSYGYGIWISIINDEVFKHFVMGFDPGVRMESSVYSKKGIRSHVISNKTNGAGSVIREIDKSIYRQYF